jgi:hypothetical protein
MKHASSTHEPYKITLRAMLLVAALLVVSCNESTEPYPDLVTEFADIRTGANGMFLSLTTDDGTCYSITNTNIKPHRPDTTYRAVAGFVPDASAANPRAHIYTLAGAQVLADSTTILRHDPTGIESMWHEGQYINMQLTARTQGGLHLWGYAVDSVQQAGEKGRTHAHHHLSIHHNQGRDPMSYSQTYYCSIHIPTIPYYIIGDTISVSVHTFSGVREWTFLHSQ